MLFLCKKKTTTATNKHILYLIGGIVVNFRVKSNEMNEAHIHTPPAKQKQHKTISELMDVHSDSKRSLGLKRCCHVAVTLLFYIVSVGLGSATRVVYIENAMKYSSSLFQHMTYILP